MTNPEEVLAKAYSLQGAPRSKHNDLNYTRMVGSGRKERAYCEDLGIVPDADGLAVNPFV